MSFIVFALSACNADVVKIEDYEWEMRTVMSNDTESAQYQDELVVAVMRKTENTKTLSACCTVLPLP